MAIRICLGFPIPVKNGLHPPIGLYVHILPKSKLRRSLSGLHMGGVGVTMPDASTQRWILVWATLHNCNRPRGCEVVGFRMGGPHICVLLTIPPISALGMVI